MLVEHGAKVNGSDPWTPVEEALYWGMLAGAKRLVELGAEIRSLRAAAGLGAMTELEEFFDGDTLSNSAGAILSPFGDGVKGHGSSDAQVLLDNALAVASTNNQVDAAALLLDRGADVSSYPLGLHHGGTALHAAAWQGHEAVATLLLERGADRAAPDTSEDKSTAADWASWNGFPDLAKLLQPPT